MAVTLGVFNANNLFLRYKFGRRFPGDLSGRSVVTDARWGFLPAYQPGTFVPYRPEPVALCAQALRGGDGALPDILCLSEIESLLALRVFNADHLGGHYPHALLIDSYDFRQIDVALLTRFEPLAVRTHVDDVDDHGEHLFSRDCLEVTLALTKSGSKTFTVFLNHLKSKFVDRKGKTPAQIRAAERQATTRREAQARALRAIVRARFPGAAFGQAHFAVVGDLNAAPGEVSVAPLVTGAGLHNVVDDLPPAERWTYWWKAKNRASQIDYLLLSPALRDAGARAGLRPRIERRGIGFRRALADGAPGPRQTTIVRDEAAPEDGLPVPFDFPPLRRRVGDPCGVRPLPGRAGVAGVDRTTESWRTRGGRRPAA